MVIVPVMKIVVIQMKAMIVADRMLTVWIRENVCLCPLYVSTGLE
jgi:hypothetical protein